MISQDAKDLLKNEIEKLKVQKSSIDNELEVLKKRRDELQIKKEAINSKLQKFQNDIGN